jgi:hypothetical protein
MVMAVLIAWGTREDLIPKSFSRSWASLYHLAGCFAVLVIRAIAATARILLRGTSAQSVPE